MDSTEITETDKDEYGLLNVSVKDEPLDLYESIPYDVTIKDEPEDINEFEDPFINFDNLDDKNILKTSPETTPISGSEEKVQVQCPRCKNSVLIDNFREHIDLCPPRRKYESNAVEGDLNCTKNVLDSQSTPRKSLNEVELQKNVSSPRTTRSKSFGRQLNNGKNKGNEANVDVDLNAVKVESHASQMAYYQKLLKIRSKSSVSHTLGNSKLSDSDGIESVSIQSIKVDNHDETFDDLLLLQDNTFACSLCSYTTDKQRNLRDHERSHRLRNQPISKCVYCNQKYTNYALYLHIRKVHPGQKFVLPDDDGKNVDTSKEIAFDGSFPPEAEKIPNDLFKNIKQETFSCSICSYTTHNHRNLRNHNRAHHIHRKPIFQCVYCNEKYTQHALSLHTRKIHPGQEVMLPKEEELIPTDVDPFQKTKRINLQLFKCQKCPFYAKTRILLTEHIADNHSASDQSTLRCNKCSYSTKKRYYMSKHQSLHGKNVVVSKCRWCDYRAFPKGLWAHKAKCPNVPIEPSKESIVTTQDVITKHPRTRNKTTANKVDESNNKDCDDDDDKLLNDDKSESLQTVRRAFPKELWAHETKCPNVPIEPSKESVVTTQRVITKHPRTRNKTTANKVDESNYKDCDDDDKLLNDDKSESLQTVRRALPKELWAHETKCPNVPIEPSTESVVTTQRVITKHPRTRNKTTANKVDESNNKDCDDDDDKLLNDDKSESLKTVYNCKLCSLRCTTIAAFRKHVKCHAGKQPITKCSLCDFKSTPACLREHIREQDHYTKKGLIKTIKCTLCSVLFASKRALGLHLKDHAQNPTKKCSRCNFKSTATYLAKHVREKQHYAKNFQCTLCPFSTSLRIRLNMHKKKRHPDSMESTKKTSGKRKKPEKKFSCKFCSYTSPFEFVWEKHVQSHNIYNKPIFQCPECGFKGTKSKIACHKKCGNAKPPKKVLLSCAQCSFTTHFPGALSAHEKNDHGDTKIIKTVKVGTIKSFQCELCSFSTYWQYLFEKHMDSHTVLKLSVEQCPNCDFRSTPACLTAHRKKCIKTTAHKRP